MNQRNENIGISLMFVGWAVLRVTTADPPDRWTIPQLIPAGLHVVVAMLFLNRNPWNHNGSAAAIAWSLPSFVVGGLAINLAPAPHQWPHGPQLLFATAAIGAATGMMFLGRSFAIFPAVRTIVKKGPFQVIRHPIYFFELVMISACCAASGNPMHWVIFMPGVASVAVRIIVEERVLTQSAQYVDYCRSVRFRLIPGIW